MRLVPILLAITLGACAGSGHQHGPGSDPGTNPGGDPGTDPGGDPGTNPGGDPGTNPGSDPGSNPGSDPVDEPDHCAPEADGAPWLAFASRRTGDYEIWRARSDGSCLAQVTRAPGPDLFPTWSGQTVVFVSERDGTQALWSHDLATGAEARVDTGDLVAATAPAFSPDGTLLAFEGRPAGARTSGVYLVPVAGGVVRSLEETLGAGAGPAWSADGTRIYFVSTRSGAYEVWTAPAAGGAATQVTTGSRIVGKPAVTADGAALVYARSVAGASTTEVVKRLLSTGEVTVVSSHDDSEPAVCPDGQHLALRSFRRGHADLVVVGLDGAEVLALTDDEASDGTPAFAQRR